MEMNSSFKQDCINLYYGNAEMEHYETIQRGTSQQQFMLDTQAPGSVSMKIQQLLIPASSALAT